MYIFDFNTGHPVLWRALARGALRAMDMDVAEHALMRCGDLQVDILSAMGNES